MSDLVLVVNAGSSSLKYSLVDASSGATPASGLVERIGEPSGVLTHRSSGGSHRSESSFADHEAALKSALDAFETHGPSLSSVTLGAVGHRVVHGGSTFSAPTLVDDDLVSAVSSLVPLAPLHNPANLEGIATARRLFPAVPQVAIFDTAFHHTLPPHAYTYALPHDWVEDHQIRRYGFHGTSYSFVASAAARFLGRPLTDLNLIVLHLGNGASATAIQGGESVDTSMGMTPLEGLVMGTRSGDVDPALHAHLNRRLGWSLDTVDDILNRSSGLKGLAGVNDFRELDRQRASGVDAGTVGVRRVLLPDPQVRRRLLRRARHRRCDRVHRRRRTERSLGAQRLAVRPAAAGHPGRPRAERAALRHSVRDLPRRRRGHGARRTHRRGVGDRPPGDGRRPHLSRSYVGRRNPDERRREMTRRTPPATGDHAELTRTVAPRDIELFTEISGDRNPLHYDEEAARASRFGEIVVQGGITSAILNAVVAEELPGPGTVFLNVNWDFKAPVRPGDTITGRVEVLEARQDKPITTLRTTVTRGDGTVVLDGTAVTYTMSLGNGG